MGYLYYDRVSKMFTLAADGEVAFLGPTTQSLLRLQSFGFTPSQAREAVLQAVFNMGDAVDLDFISRFACSFKKNDGKDT
jgi:hypothetical protein